MRHQRLQPPRAPTHPRRVAARVGAYLDLTPGQWQSSDRDTHRGITKTGDRAARRLLVECAQRILSKRGIDSDPKRHGQKILRAGGGTKETQRRAVTAVARKLAIVSHHLCITGEAYQPLRNNSPATMTP